MSPFAPPNWTCCTVAESFASQFTGAPFSSTPRANSLRLQPFANRPSNRSHCTVYFGHTIGEVVALSVSTASILMAARHCWQSLSGRSQPPFMTDPIAISAGVLSDPNRDLQVPMTGAQRFLRACLRQPVDVTPVWFLRQAGRYMAEYQAVRRHHSLLEICQTPEIAAEVTITAAEKLDVDAAIIFADLLLPLEVMGMPFRFEAGEGPVIEQPLRSPKQIDALVTDRAAELNYVSESVRRVARHFGEKMPVIGFCGAPFTLASYMIEGGGSRNYIHTKRMMYGEPAAWQML